MEGRHACVAVELVLDGVFDLLLHVLRDVVAVSDVADPRQRHRRSVLPRE